MEWTLQGEKQFGRGKKCLLTYKEGDLEEYFFIRTEVSVHVSVPQVFRDHTRSVMTELIAAEITFTTCI